MLLVLLGSLAAGVITGITAVELLIATRPLKHRAVTFHPELDTLPEDSFYWLSPAEQTQLVDILVLDHLRKHRYRRTLTSANMPLFQYAPNAPSQDAEVQNLQATRALLQLALQKRRTLPIHPAVDGPHGPASLSALQLALARVEDELFTSMRNARKAETNNGSNTSDSMVRSRSYPSGALYTTADWTRDSERFRVSKESSS